jgi:hypothetical protein
MAARDAFFSSGSWILFVDENSCSTKENGQRLVLRPSKPVATDPVDLLQEADHLIS